MSDTVASQGYGIETPASPPRMGFARGASAEGGPYVRANSGLPRVIIPPLPEFIPGLAPEETPRDRAQRLLREMEKRFGGRALRKLPHEVEQEAVRARRAQWQPELDREPVSETCEPEWERYGFRGQVGELLWQRGLKKKAIRFLSCNKCARPGVCKLYPLEHRYFVPNGCEVVFCKECAEEVRRALFLAYQAVILAVMLRGVPHGWYLARINFTLRSDGSEITPERVKKFNACVGVAMRRTVGSRKGYGLLFVDEVGFEKRGHLPDVQRVAHGLNLHCHGLYFGPRLDWRQTRDLWAEETKKKFGVESLGFFIKPIRWFAQNPERAVRRALNHMLKYVSKPPAVTPERLASLIAAFNTAKRVHSLGLFYGKKPKREKRDCLCPKCRALGIVSAVSFEGRELPNGGCVPRLEQIEVLLKQGYVLLRDASRDAVLSMGASREDTWGAPP